MVMGKWLRAGAVLASVAGLAIGTAHLMAQREYKNGIVWPEPVVVAPGEKLGDPPADAVVLFDGKSLDQWNKGENWIVKDGAATVQKSDILTKGSFGPDYQLHVEFATPAKVTGSSQGRGNSGIFLANRYEVQVLDSYGNKTYFDGQCGSLYKQNPPMVNVCRKPGEWQTFDIIFNSPHFGEDGKLLKPGFVTVIQNGVVVQNHTELWGNTFFDRPAAYQKHPLKQPIRIQNHGNPVKYRNIWLREFAPLVGKKPDVKKK